MVRIKLQVAAGAACAIGSLPHRDADQAAAFVLELLPQLPAMPTLPRRCPAEGMIAQAVVGIPGITLGPYGSAGARHRPDRSLGAPVDTDLDHDAFGGFRAFLRRAAGRTGPVKWQFVGPVTLGIALIRAGLPADVAFDVAVHAVRSHVAALHRLVATALPDAQQLVVLDEPDFAEVTDPDFPIALDTAIDLLSGALATVEADRPHRASTAAATPIGRVCSPPARGRCSLPVTDSLIAVGGYLARFLRVGWLDRAGARCRPTDRSAHGGAVVACAVEVVVRSGQRRLRPGPAPHARR